MFSQAAFGLAEVGGTTGAVISRPRSFPQVSKPSRLTPRAVLVVLFLSS